jgi:hypothetical protein
LNDLRTGSSGDGAAYHILFEEYSSCSVSPLP